jgi:hypothetical protein
MTRLQTAANRAISQRSLFLTMSQVARNVRVTLNSRKIDNEMR